MMPDYIELPDDLNERIEVLKLKLREDMQALLYRYVTSALNSFFSREEIVQGFADANIPLPVYAKIEAEANAWDDDSYSDRIESINLFDANDKVISVYDIEFQKPDRPYKSDVGDEIYDSLIYGVYDLCKYAGDLAKYSDYNQKFYIGVDNDYE